MNPITIKLRNRSYYRRVRTRAINHKLFIAEHIMQWECKDKPRVVGSFGKGKVHCSCSLCSAKSRGHRINDGWNTKDLRTFEKLKHSIKEYRDND